MSLLNPFFCVQGSTICLTSSTPAFLVSCFFFYSPVSRVKLPSQLASLHARSEGMFVRPRDPHHYLEKLIPIVASRLAGVLRRGDGTQRLDFVHRYKGYS